MKTYYIILVNGVPEQVTEYWGRAKDVCEQLTSRNREARIVPCVSTDPEGEPVDFEDTITEEIDRPEM